MGKPETKNRKYHIGDIVKCDRFDKGDCKVIDVRYSSEPEVRILNLNSGKADWFYEAHCSCDFKTRRHNFDRRSNSKLEIVKNILNKPKLKR